MHPGHPPHNEFNRPEYNPCDYINVLRDIVDDESTTDSKSCAFRQKFLSYSPGRELLSRRRSYPRFHFQNGRTIFFHSLKPQSALFFERRIHRSCPLMGRFHVDDDDAPSQVHLFHIQVSCIRERNQPLCFHSVKCSPYF